MSGAEIYRHAMLAAYSLFMVALMAAVWPRIGWPDRVVDVLLIIGVGRMLFSEVRLGR